MSRRQQSGFTIVEMMIATAIFSIILLIITAGVMAFSRQYMRGQTASNLQFTARQVTAQMGQDIQFGTGVEAAGPVQFKTDLTYKVDVIALAQICTYIKLAAKLKTPSMV
ncbi:MAG TPA: prepilin-type N-terminal cleavage/methylation domain-containing protein [Candidatus Saccharibacteria bacterium]|nr:prepilin-type N-terminal cleavage/methylation domain-containing protein [Candidatus Saccharibacteria bacterium]